MTSAKYKRLFLVLFLPLMLAGFVLSLFSPFGFKYLLYCGTGGVNHYCSVDPSDDWRFYKYEQSQTKGAWFEADLDAAREGFVRPYLISAFQRTLRDVRLTEFTSYSGSPTPKLILDKLGKSGFVRLGIPDGENSLYDGKTFYLYCNSLHIKNGLTTASCYGEGWSGLFKLEPSAADKEIINGLERAVDTAMQQRRLEYFGYAATVYPIFVYLFLFVSFLSYLFIKAKRYVKNG